MRDGRARLLRGVDHNKDQSYVLFGIGRREALEHTLLPVGGMEKGRVRELAEELKLPVYNKPDSQEICFVGGGDYADVVRRRTPEAMGEGEMVGEDGQVLGRHGGHQQFTIGQRRGTGVARGTPLYVLNINAPRNRVTLGPRALMRGELVARQLNVHCERLAGGEEVRCMPKSATITSRRRPSPGSWGRINWR